MIIEKCGTLRGYIQRLHAAKITETYVEFGISESTFQSGKTTETVLGFTVWLTSAISHADLHIVSTEMRIHMPVITNTYESLLEALEELRLHLAQKQIQLHTGSISIPGMVAPEGMMTVTQYIETIQRSNSTALANELLQRFYAVFSEFDELRMSTSQDDENTKVDVNASAVETLVDMFAEDSAETK